MSGIMSKASHVLVKPESSWKTILECATVEVFEMMANVHLDPEPSPEGVPSGDFTAMVGMAGALCGMTSIRCPRAVAARLAAAMLGEESTANPSAPEDALGELCNMVAGNFKSKISTLADHCLLSVPTVISGEDYTLQALQPVQSFVLALRHESEKIWVSLLVHE
ncbi:MAG TPA: chemotaxis protein CheX [Methylomirabilota bacterium]|nr:chemotaxis protein CheX [Methylomirabilota bacterium]